jgi:maleylacetoacetate isomerase
MSASAPSTAGKLTLFSYWRSSCSWRVRLTLAHKALPYAYEAVHLVREGGEQFFSEFSTLNPMHQVPALVHETPLAEGVSPAPGPSTGAEDGGSPAAPTSLKVTISQSIAICNYLEERFPDAPSIFPTDVVARAKVCNRWPPRELSENAPLLRKCVSCAQPPPR